MISNAHKGFRLCDRERAVLVLLLIGCVVGCGKEEPVEPPVRPVRAMQVANTPSITGRAFPGRAKASAEVNLAFRVSGPLAADHGCHTGAIRHLLQSAIATTLIGP